MIKQTQAQGEDSLTRPKCPSLSPQCSGRVHSRHLPYSLVQLLACCRHQVCERAQPGECILLGLTILFSRGTGSVQQTASVNHGSGRADERAPRRYIPCHKDGQHDRPLLAIVPPRRPHLRDALSMPAPSCPRPMPVLNSNAALHERLAPCYGTLTQWTCHLEQGSFKLTISQRLSFHAMLSFPRGSKLQHALDHASPCQLKSPIWLPKPTDPEDLLKASSLRTTLA